MVRLAVYYWDKEIKLIYLDSSEWIEKAPNNILKIWWQDSIWHNVKGYSIYCFKDGVFFGINQTIGRAEFLNKTDIDLKDVFPNLPNFARHGYELNNKEWLRVEQLKPE